MKLRLLCHRLRIRFITAPLRWCRERWCGLAHRKAHRRYLVGNLHTQHCLHCGCVTDIAVKPDEVVHTCGSPSGICMCAINQILERTRGR